MGIQFDDDEKKKKKGKRPGKWNVVDALVGILGLAAILALTAAAFLAAKWAIATYF